MGRQAYAAYEKVRERTSPCRGDYVKIHCYHLESLGWVCPNPDDFERVNRFECVLGVNGITQREKYCVTTATFEDPDLWRASLPSRAAPRAL